MSQYTHTVTEPGPFDPHPKLVISCDGAIIFEWPAACIPASTHEAMAHKVEQLHRNTRRQAQDEIRKQFRELIGAGTGTEHLDCSSYGR